jgi:hypothetical protein
MVNTAHAVAIAGQSHGRVVAALASEILSAGGLILHSVFTEEQSWVGDRLYGRT